MFSISAQPRPMATDPSIWPRHCMGLISRPISAACALCRMRISPVIRFTASRTPCTLADDAIAFELPFRRRGRSLERSKSENIVAQSRSRERHRLPGDDSAGAREGACVIRGQIGIGVDDLDLLGTRAEDAGGDLTM